MKLYIFTSSLVLVLPINVFFCDFTAFFAAGVFADECRSAHRVPL
jgi:hypothetical protein